MSWTELSPPPARFTGAPMKIGALTHSMFLTLSSAFVTKHRLKAGQKFKVMAGHGESQGLIKLERDDAGAFELKMNAKGSLKISLPRLDGIPEGRQKAQPATFQLHSSDPFVLQVVVPWLPRPRVESKPARRQVPRAKPDTTGAPPIDQPRHSDTGGTDKGAVDVTASLMGDPPPKRSAARRG